MLETTLKTEFIPGTNLSDSLACADWRFLLPTLEVDNVLCVGSPTVRVLAVLAAMSHVVYVVCENELQAVEIDEQRRNADWENIIVVQVGRCADLPFLAGTIDLIHVTKAQNQTTTLRNRALHSEFGRILKPDGVIYFEVQRVAVDFVCRNFLKNLSKQGLEASNQFWLAPLRGEFSIALPVEDSTISTYVFRNVMYGRSAKKRLLSHAGRVLSRVGLVGHLAPRRSILLKRSGRNGYPGKLPEYIADMADRAGIDVSHYRFGLSCHGKYNSNKVIFFLFDQERKTPKVVIKMTRSPDLNHRLENEYRVLLQLNEEGYIDQATFPQPLFFGYHNKLSLLGLKAVEGAPFRARTAATPGCPIAGNAIDRIVQLGTSSANRHVASADKVARALAELLDRFDEIYGLGKRERGFLTEQLHTIGCSRRDFPLVFQHGDPGTWNIMVSEESKAIFIDWEAGEPKGMPLWDLFYFFRTYASWVSRMQGSRDALEIFSQHFLSSSELSAMLMEVTNQYCTKIGLDKRLVKPLFYTCWIQRALKEATRLTKASLQNGHYANLLRLNIENRNAPPLVSLFSLNS